MDKANLWEEAVAMLDDGVVTEEYTDDKPKYDVQGVFKYCRKNGIEPIDLPEKKLKEFEIK